MARRWNYHIYRADPLQTPQHQMGSELILLSFCITVLAGTNLQCVVSDHWLGSWQHIDIVFVTTSELKLHVRLGTNTYGQPFQQQRWHVDQM
eukprot:5475501-Amphidinium_carterae.1